MGSTVSYKWKRSFVLVEGWVGTPIRRRELTGKVGASDWVRWSQPRAGRKESRSLSVVGEVKQPK
ncbi:hypothetical protein KFK09_011498 [Dendrobium nobile]|uniref:Uncharacterized protein n=1 Tax=Dendrobium nobile TaxID=94219 RepID=A0A8T3BID1_DENNO|nr:hypothetical protein KFK09_011498 [Dendrobium nobile]